MGFGLGGGEGIPPAISVPVGSGFGGGGNGMRSACRLVRTWPGGLTTD